MLIFAENSLHSQDLTLKLLASYVYLAENVTNNTINTENVSDFISILIRLSIFITIYKKKLLLIPLLKNTLLNYKNVPPGV